jgi:hypothetical protein
MQTKRDFASSTDMWSKSAGGHLMKVVNLTGFTVYINPFSARGPIYRPPQCLRRMREADVSAHFFQALQSFVFKMRRVIQKQAKQC